MSLLNDLTQGKHFPNEVLNHICNNHRHQMSAGCLETDHVSSGWKELLSQVVDHCCCSMTRVFLEGESPNASVVADHKKCHVDTHVVAEANRYQVEHHNQQEIEVRRNDLWFAHQASELTMMLRFAEQLVQYHSYER